MIDVVCPKDAVEFIKKGEVVAYPTEAVYGLGCDPRNCQALDNILKIKSRDSNKGLILIASQMDQIKFYIDFDSLSVQVKDNIAKTWPGFVTWLLPINTANLVNINPILYGRYDTIAVRISNHPVVVSLCELFSGPLVSTSANLSGQAEIKDLSVLKKMLSTVDYNNQLVKAIVVGELGGYERPSTIIDGSSGKIIRE